MRKNMIDYDDLKLFYQTVVETVFNPRHIEGEAHPVRVLAKIEQESRALARRSLRIGVSDAMAKLRDETPEAISELSKKLAAIGAPSIPMVRAYLSRKWAEIIKHGVIETEEQFYLVRELADDPNIAQKDRYKLMDMLEGYELKRQNGAPPSKP